MHFKVFLSVLCHFYDAFMSILDEQPLPDKNWDDEGAWRALYQDLMARTREEVKGLEKSMDNNLVFVSKGFLLG